MRWCHGVLSPTLRIVSQSSSLSGVYNSGHKATLYSAQMLGYASHFVCPQNVIHNSKNIFLIVNKDDGFSKGNKFDFFFI